MVARHHSASFLYPRRAGAVRSATRVDYRSLLLIIGLLALLAFGGVLYLSQASAAAELRFRLSAAEQEAEDLWAENLGLREEIARCQRLTAIEERVARLGMVGAAADGPFLVCVLPERQEPAASAAVAPADEAPSEGTRTGFWARLLSRFLGLGGPGARQIAAVRGGRR